MKIRCLHTPWLAALVLLSLNTGCRDRQTLADQATAKGTLLISNSAEPADLDPQTITGNPENNIVHALFEGLVRYHPETLDPVPAVASHWDLAEDGVTYTFHLREDARWSDGVPVTAHDFHRAYQRMLSPKLASHNADGLYRLKGAEDYHQGRSTDFSTVGSRVVDEFTLELTAAQPTPFFVRSLSNRRWFPVPIHVLEKHDALERQGTPWTRPENLVGNGPFVLESWEPNRVIETARSTTYWNRNEVSLKRIHFLPIENSTSEEAAYRAGQLHVILNLPISKIETYRRERPDELNISPASNTYYYAFNLTRPPLDDPRVRTALALAIDREAITREVTRAGQQVARHFVPPGISGYYSQVPGVSLDLDRARELLAEAGFPDGLGFPTLTLLYNTAESHKTIAQAVQQMWRQGLGIDIQLENQEWQVYVDSMQRHDFDISRATLGFAPDDPTTYFEIHSTGHGFNISAWSDPEFDSLLDLALNETEPEVRAEIFAKMDQRLIAEMPIAPIYHGTYIHVVRPEVKNWTENMIQSLPLREASLEP